MKENTIKNLEGFIIYFQFIWKSLFIDVLKNLIKCNFWEKKELEKELNIFLYLYNSLYFN